MIIQIPELSLVVLMGASGSGKSTFATHHFRATEILSSDFCRGLVSDDESNQAATADAFAVLHLIAEKRLAAGKLTVIDATNVQKEARKPFLELAKSQNVLPIVIVLDLPAELCHGRNISRSDRQFGPHVVRQQVAQLKKSLRHLEAEGFRYRHVLSSPEEVEVSTIERQPLWNNRKWDHGPFDIIGDIHGCYEELVELLERLGYQFAPDGVIPPLGRKAVFLGDLVDRGPMAPEVVELVRAMVRTGQALGVPGNHDAKFVRAARGRKVQLTHGLARTMEQYALRESVDGELMAAADFLEQLISHYVLDEGRLVVAHAGLTQALQGRSSGTVREFCLYGDVTGETDEEGYPVRRDWAVNYRGPAKVVYGHIVVPRAEWVNNTMNIDTGCVFGGRLTALRYPELELVSVPARRAYVEGRVNFEPVSQLSSQQQTEDVLDLADFTGKRVIETSLMGNVIIREENSAAALEVMSRFAVAPQWLIYLPPTMSPCATAAAENFLEHPLEAFAYFAEHGVERVVCEQKHMGSRAIVIVGRSAEAIRQRFGFLSAHKVGLGMIYTRTGRRFFEEESIEQGFAEHLVQVLSSVDFWEAFQTDWVCLDAEVMPWSFKGAELLLRQYAPVGAAAEVSLRAALELMTPTTGRPELVNFGKVLAARAAAVEDYRDTYRRYCWPVTGWQELKMAPFQILATEGRTYFDHPHRWHLEQAAAWASHDSHGVIIPTHLRELNPGNLAECEAATARWEELTRNGSEGMVVKPENPVTRHSGKLVQPGVKCRGREYLRLIYGPTYLEQLEQLRSRNLGAKRSLALREFALGIEALERFVRREPLRRVHECVFGVLALETEPVNPRL